MKLIKKLLVIASLIPLLTSTTTPDIHSTSKKATLLADGNTQSGEYDITDETIIRPKSIPITKAI